MDDLCEGSASCPRISWSWFVLFVRTGIPMEHRYIMYQHTDTWYSGVYPQIGMHRSYRFPIGPVHTAHIERYAMVWWTLLLIMYDRGHEWNHHLLAAWHPCHLNDTFHYWWLRVLPRTTLLKEALSYKSIAPSFDWGMHASTLKAVTLCCCLASHVFL